MVPMEAEPGEAGAEDSSEAQVGPAPGRWNGVRALDPRAPPFPHESRVRPQLSRGASGYGAGSRDAEGEAGASSRGCSEPGAGRAGRKGLPPRRSPWAVFKWNWREGWGQEGDLRPTGGDVQMPRDRVRKPVFSQ